MEDIEHYLVVLNYPEQDISAIERIVQESNFFITTNLTHRSVLYKITSHHDPRNSIRFRAMFDRNIYTDLTTLATHSDPKEVRAEHCLRSSAALLAFLQIANITVDYGASLYEYADSHSGDDAIQELQAFRRIDNSNPKHLIDFALGRIDSVSDLVQPLVDEEPPVSGREFEKRLWKFRVAYTCALKIAEIQIHCNPGKEKMMLLLDWMYNDFLFSSAAMLFANRLFCPNPISRMLKGNDRSSIRNAAWDIFLVQEWRSRTLAPADESIAPILCTRDRAVLDITRSMMCDTTSDVEQIFAETWGRKTGDGKQIFSRYCELVSQVGQADRRTLSVEEQVRILKELETTLGLSLRDTSA